VDGLVAEVGLERDSGVAIVTLRAPARRNAFTPSMVTELLGICDEIDTDTSIGAVVVRGEGESFCAGAHRALLDAASQDPVAAEHYDALSLTYRAFVRVGELAPATVAAVRGHAIGAGVNLMLATDLRIVARTARIATGFQRIGLHPGGGHFTLLGRLGSREAAAGLSVFGQTIDGQRAVELGLAWEAVDEAEVESRALELAREPARDPQLARAVVRSFRTELGPPAVPWTAALEVERGVQAWSLRRRVH
jgi:enoyl-CoA hydratase